MPRHTAGGRRAARPGQAGSLLGALTQAGGSSTSCRSHTYILLQLTITNQREPSLGYLIRADFD